jgi:FkbM family methyltransferase
MLKVNHRSGSFWVNLEQDPYGEDFWKNIESRRYEPDTVGFLEDNLSSRNTFMDIGAANGAITIIAALLGSQVVSYEPDPNMFDVLKSNIELNPIIKEKVTLNNSGISNKPSTLEFNGNADSSILSSIVVGTIKSKGQLVSIRGLSEEINRVHADKTKKLMIKMDIEGAEWRILNDQQVLETLNEHHATVLLAVHPGFYRPHKKFFKGVDRLAITFWHLQNYFESLRTYSKIVKYAQISRTNLNPVRSKHIFAILVLGGYHEFVLKF